MAISQLPHELILAVAEEHLDRPSLTRLSTTNKAFHALATPLLQQRISFTSMAERDGFALLVEGHLKEYSSLYALGNIPRHDAPQDVDENDDEVTLVESTDRKEALIWNDDDLFSLSKSSSSLSLTKKISTTTWLGHVRRLDFGLCPNKRAIHSSIEPAYGDAWSDRFISSLLHSASLVCPSLTHLDLSGCQFYESVFVSVLERIGQTLVYLNVSYSNIRSLGFQGIQEHCPNVLQVLNVSGLFRFRRISMGVMEGVLERCHGLKRLVSLDNPDLNGPALSLRAQEIRSFEDSGKRRAHALIIITESQASNACISDNAEE